MTSGVGSVTWIGGMTAFSGVTSQGVRKGSGGGVGGRSFSTMNILDLGGGRTIPFSSASKPDMLSGREVETGLPRFLQSGSEKKCVV